MVRFAYKYIQCHTKHTWSSLSSLSIAKHQTRQVLIVIPDKYSLLYQTSTHCYTRQVLIVIPDKYSLLYQTSTHCYTRQVLIAIPDKYSLLYQTSTHCYARQVLIVIPDKYSLLYQTSTHCLPGWIRGVEVCCQIHIISYHLMSLPTGNHPMPCDEK